MEASEALKQIVGWANDVISLEGTEGQATRYELVSVMREIVKVNSEVPTK